MLRVRKDETRGSSTKSLAQILIFVASSSTFTKELRHLNPTLKHTINPNSRSYYKQGTINVNNTSITLNCWTNTLVSMSTSFGITSPSPSGSTKLVFIPRFPTLPLRPESKAWPWPLIKSRAQDPLTDPVHVLVHIIGHVIVDNMSNIGDVKP